MPTRKSRVQGSGDDHCWEGEGGLPPIKCSVISQDKLIGFCIQRADSAYFIKGAHFIKGPHAVAAISLRPLGPTTGLHCETPF